MAHTPNYEQPLAPLFTDPGDEQLDLQLDAAFFAASGDDLPGEEWDQ